MAQLEKSTIISLTTTLKGEPDSKKAVDKARKRERSLRRRNRSMNILLRKDRK